MLIGYVIGSGGNDIVPQPRVLGMIKQLRAFLEGCPYRISTCIVQRPRGFGHDQTIASIPGGVSLQNVHVQSRPFS